MQLSESNLKYYLTQHRIYQKGLKEIPTLT